MSAPTIDRPNPTHAAPAYEPIPFARLLRVEWSKATDTRAARWLIGLTVVATIALMLAPLLARTRISQDYVTYSGFAAFGLSTLLPVVAVMTMTSEWSQRTVLATFTQEPRRTRVIGAKVTVSVLMSLIACVFGALVTAGAIGIAEATGRTVVNNLHPAEVIGFVLFVLVQVLMGVAFGAVLHNTAASIVLIFVLPIAFGILSNALSSVGRWIDPGTTFNYIRDGRWDGHTGPIIVCLLIWLIVPLAVGIVRTIRREIK